MAKIDLDNADVHHVEATVDDIRNEAESLKDALDTAMDEAQGRVFTGESTVEYVVIEVRKSHP